MFLAVATEIFRAADVLSQAIAHDKGKPAARQGRKAVSLSEGAISEVPKALLS